MRSNRTYGWGIHREGGFWIGLQRRRVRLFEILGVTLDKQGREIGSELGGKKRTGEGGGRWYWGRLLITRAKVDDGCMMEGAI